VIHTEHAISLDPGSKPGVVEWEREEYMDPSGAVGPWELIRVTHDIEADWIYARVWDIAATEGQWYFGAKRDANGQRKDVDVNSLLKLAFRAGWQFRGIRAKRYLQVQPQVWRGGSSVNKLQMQKRILRDLTPAERELFRGIPEARHGDVLDAIGIGKRALKLAATTREYDYK
jgi:hypothetical protein